MQGLVCRKGGAQPPTHCAITTHNVQLAMSTSDFHISVTLIKSIFQTVCQIDSIFRIITD
jgi:hypothetical protein